MSTSSLNSQSSESGRSSAWSSWSAKLQNIKEKTSNYARSKGSELAGYANQQGRNIISRIKKEEPVQPPVVEEKERYVFGVPLECVMANSGHEYGIPLIVYQCINELTYSIDEVGIYRIPGSSHQVEVLRDKYDFLEPVDLSQENPNTIATLLKLFLRKLPNKLVDEDHNAKLNDIIRKHNIENPEEFTEFDEIAEVLEDLPGWEYNLLGYICFHLKSVADNAEYNKMTLNNLGLIFCPTLKIAPAVFSILVLHSQNVFRRFLSDDDAYEQGENAESKNNEEYANEDYDENEDNTNTNEQEYPTTNNNYNNNNNNENNNENKENSNDETNFADFENNQELLKFNSNFEEKNTTTKDDENTSETLISLEDENKASS